MKSVKIVFKGIGDVRNFVSIAEKCDFDIDVVQGRYTVDAKSIIGIFSLDHSKSLELIIHSDECAEFLAAIKPYIAA